MVQIRQKSPDFLPKDDAVAIDGRDNDLPHPVGPVRRFRAGCPARYDLGMQGIDIVDIEVAEPVVRTEIRGWQIIWAVPQHHPHTVPLNKSPICRILPENPEAQYIPEVDSAFVEVWDREHERPGGDSWRHAARPQQPQLSALNAIVAGIVAGAKCQILSTSVFLSISIGPASYLNGL